MTLVHNERVKLTATVQATIIGLTFIPGDGGGDGILFRERKAP